MAFITFLLILFVVKTTQWWLGVAAGRIVIGEVTAGGWVLVAFYHVAVVAGVFGVVEMFQARFRRPDAAQTATPDRNDKS